MDYETIEFDENYNDEEEPQIISSMESNQNAEILQIVPEEIDISETFFMGVQIGSIMCMLSLGIYVILRIFKVSQS